MSEPTKTAFCPLYFSFHGGQFNERGMAVFDRVPIAGMCDRAFDCGTCALMSKWLNEMFDDGWDIGWECDKCLKQTYEPDKEAGIRRNLPGFFQSTQPDEQAPGYIPGCTRCGWPGSFLQVILRRQHG